MKICCIGYREWALEIYNELYAQQVFKKMDVKFDVLIMKEYDEKKIRDYNPTYILFYGWSNIIDKKIINDFECIMLHPSPLPKYRGGSPIQNQIIRGENDSAVTLFIMDEGIDTGDIIAQEYLSLEGNLNDIFKRIADIGLKLTKDILSNGFERRKQNDSESSYYLRRTPSESEICIDELESLDGEYLYNKIRMLQDPYPNAFIRTADGKKLKIKLVELE
tara:strand:+ start:4031 stop:4690 length:660 start_codon:yes stop_codon:yes gene_type:complete